MNSALAALAATLALVIVVRDARAGTKEVIEVHVDKSGVPVADSTKACVRRADGTVDGNDDQVTFAVTGGTLSTNLHIAIGKLPPLEWVAKKAPPIVGKGAYADQEVVIAKTDATIVCTLKPATSQSTERSATDSAPTPTGSSQDPQTNSSLQDPQTNSSLQDPQTNSSSQDPQTNSSSQDPQTNNPTPTQSSTISTSKLNESALAALTREKVIDHRTPSGSERSFGGTYTLYHLPDGSAAFPLPQHISEKDSIELAIILPLGATAKIDILACDEAPLVRVDGSLKAASSAAAFGKPESGEFTFVVKAYPVKLSCAGTLSYRIQTSGADTNGNTTTSIPIDPVYRFQWGAGAMFDFGTPHIVSLKDRPAASGMGNEKFVTDSTGRSGFKPIITLGASICRTNPKAFNACDVFVPTVWIDPTRATSGFGWGVGIRPGNYLTLLVGMTVFETQSTERGVDAPVGSTWTAPGDLPTHSEYTKKSIGFALGLSLDTALFAKVFNKD